MRKLVSLFCINRNDIRELENNHRMYALKNEMDHEVIEYKEKKGSISGKMNIILKILQTGEENDEFIFADNYCYFYNFDFYPSFEKSIYIFKYKSLICIKNNKENIIYISNLYKENSIIYVKNGYDENTRKTDEKILEYTFNEKGVYFLINRFKHNETIKTLKNIFCFTFEDNSAYYANLFSYYKHIVPDICPSFETYNIGNEIAFITMNTPNIRTLGHFSENSVKKFCKRNNITYYIYRDVPDFLKKSNILDVWCKPYLLLNHFENHKYVFWIDSDILIGNKYNLDIKGDLMLFGDCSSNIPFNSGFMGFKTTEKNKKMIEKVKEMFEELKKQHGKLEGVYTHSFGDQPRFNQVVAEYYPDYIALSSEIGNTNLEYPYDVNPKDQTRMFHFMGGPVYTKELLMICISNAWKYS